MGSWINNSVIIICRIIMLIFKCYNWEEKIKCFSWFFCGSVLLLFSCILFGIIYLISGM